MAKGKSTLDRIRDKDVQVLEELSFDQLLDKLSQDGELDEVSDLGDGYHLIKGKEGKAKLVGVPLVILDWRVNEKWKFGPGVTLHIRTGVPVVFDGRAYDRFILNDGSTGIADQIAQRVASGKTGAILCRRGLSRSDYEVTDDSGNPVIDPATNKPVEGTTFYFDTSV